MAKSNYCIMYHNTDPEYVHQVVNGQMQGWSGNGSFCVIFRTADDDRLCKLYDRCESIAAGWTDDNYHAATKFLDSFVHKELTKKEIPNLMGTILAIKIYAGLNNSSLTTGLAPRVRQFAAEMIDFLAVKHGAMRVSGRFAENACGGTSRLHQGIFVPFLTTLLVLLSWWHACQDHVLRSAPLRAAGRIVS